MHSHWFKLLGLISIQFVEHAFGLTHFFKNALLNRGSPIDAPSALATLRVLALARCNAQLLGGLKWLPGSVGQSVALWGNAPGVPTILCVPAHSLWECRAGIEQVGAKCTPSILRVLPCSLCRCRAGESRHGGQSGPALGPEVEHTNSSAAPPNQNLQIALNNSKINLIVFLMASVTATHAE